MKLIVFVICLFAASAQAQRLNIVVERVTVQGATNRVSALELNAARSEELQTATGGVAAWLRRSVREAIRDHKAAVADAEMQAEVTAAMERRAAAVAAAEADGGE